MLKFSAMLLGTIVTVGCQTDKSSFTDFFPQEEQQRVRSAADTQAASGARADATLQPFHFDGPKLNSLGQAKLDLMLRDDDAAQPMVVYVNMAENDASYASRADAVKRYLEDRGAIGDQIKIQAGPNPHVRTQAAGHLSRMSRTENVSTSSASESGSAPAAEPAPMAPSK
jgi:hypothetical protein